MQSYIFEDIIVDIDDILPDPNKKEPEGKKSWDSGSKENIWRSADPKDIWTADPINGKDAVEDETMKNTPDDAEDIENEDIGPDEAEGHGFDDIF